MRQKLTKSREARVGALKSISTILPTVIGLRVSFFTKNYQVIFIDPSTGWGDWSEQGVQVENYTYTVSVGDEQMIMTVTKKAIFFGTEVIGGQTLKVVADEIKVSLLEYTQLGAKGKIKEMCTFQ